MTKILVVDDHTLFRDGVKSLLKTYPEFQVVGEGATGAEAVNLACDLSPDIVLLDIGMQTISGLEALAKIKRRCSETKVLMLTQYDQEEYLFRALQTGASGYVLKETASDELVFAIEAVNKGQVYLSPAMTQTVVREFLSEGKSATEKTDGLSPREKEVLQLLAQGFTSKQIAGKLFISFKTVQTHRAHLMEKLHLDNRIGLVKYAIRKGIISADE